MAHHPVRLMLQSCFVDGVLNRDTLVPGTSVSFQLTPAIISKAPHDINNVNG